MNNTKLSGAALVFLGIFIILLFTKGQIEYFQIVRAEKENITNINKEKKQEEKRLNLMNQFLQGQKKSEELVAEIPSFNKEVLEKMKVDIPKYAKEMKEDQVLDYLYSEISKMNKLSNQIKINNLSINPGVVGQMQFLESDINLNIDIPSEIVLRNLLTRLYNSDEYKFFIPTLNFEEKENTAENTQNNLQVQIPLKVYYK